MRSIWKAFRCSVVVELYLRFDGKREEDLHDLPEGLAVRKKCSATTFLPVPGARVLDCMLAAD